MFVVIVVVAVVMVEITTYMIADMANLPQPKWRASAETRHDDTYRRNREAASEATHFGCRVTNTIHIVVSALHGHA